MVVCGRVTSLRSSVFVFPSFDSSLQAMRSVGTPAEKFDVTFGFISGQSKHKRTTYGNKIPFSYNLKK